MFVTILKFLHNGLQHILREDLPAGPFRRVWDAGCGAGTLSQILAAHAGEEVLLTDIEASSVDMALERLAQSASLRRMEGRVFDLQQGFSPRTDFDLVLCWAVLEHLADDAAGASSLAGALRPGGLLIVNVPLHPKLFNQLDRLEDHYRRYTRNSLTALLRSAGLEIIRFRTFGFPALLLTKILWAPFSSRESSMAASPLSRSLAPILSGVDYAFYRLGIPWGVESVVVARKPASSESGVA